MVASAMVPGACLNLLARALDLLVRLGGEKAVFMDAVTMGTKNKYLDIIVDFPAYLASCVVRRPATILAGSLLVLFGPSVVSALLRRRRVYAVKKGDQKTVATIDAMGGVTSMKTNDTVATVATCAAAVSAATLALRGMLIGGDTSDTSDGRMDEGATTVSEPAVLAIGGDAADAPPAETSTAVVPAYDPLPVRPPIATVMKAARHESEPMLQQIADDVLRQRAYEDPTSFVNEVAPLVQKPKKRFGYHPTLAAKYVQRLEREFPGVTFYADHDQMTSNCHELAAVARRVATYEIYMLMEAYGISPYLDRSDIGGNEELSYGMNTRVHYCRLTFDVRDGARNTTRMMNLQKMDKQRPGIAQVFKPGGARICTNGAENCP